MLRRSCIVFFPSSCVQKRSFFDWARHSLLLKLTKYANGKNSIAIANFPVDSGVIFRNVVISECDYERPLSIVFGTMDEGLILTFIQ